MSAALALDFDNLAPVAANDNIHPTVVGYAHSRFLALAGMGDPP